MRLKYADVAFRISGFILRRKRHPEAPPENLYSYINEILEQRDRFLRLLNMWCFLIWIMCIAAVASSKMRHVANV